MQKEEFPEWHVSTIVDCANPPDQSCCERWVSAMNRIKSKNRTRLGAVVLNHLMLIALNGPMPKDVDWLAVLEIWRNNSARGRYDGIWRSDVAGVATGLDDIMYVLNANQQQNMRTDDLY